MFHFSRLIALFIVLLLGLEASAGTIKNLGVDTLQIQDPSSSADPKIQLDGTSYIKKSKSTGKLTFSHDGVVEKNIGSGSGSGDAGASVLTNGSFEDGILTGFTSSGGTFSQGTYTNGIEGDLKYAQLSASTSGQYFETTATAVSDFSNGGCLGKIDYNSTDASGTWKIQVYDNASNLLTEQALDPKAWQSGYAPFKCPTAGTLIKLRIISTAAGIIQADRAYLGKENRTFQVAQAKLAGESYFPGAASCTYARTSTTTGSFTGNAACLGPTIALSSLGVWATTDSDLPKQTITNLPAGTYKAKFYASHVLAAANPSSMAITDGFTTCEPTKVSDGAVFQPQTIVECSFTYTTSGTRNFELVGASSASTITIFNSNTTPRSSLKFILEYWPTDSQTALVPEAQDWVIDANIGGANAAPSTSAVASYAGITNSSLDLVVNTLKGSAAALMACSSTEDSSSSTCTGAESIGLSFVPPQAGLYEACMEFSFYSDTGAMPVFQIVETGNTDQNIIQEGGARIQSGNSTAVSYYYPNRICGTFRFNSATKRTLRLFYEKASSTNTGLIIADRDASSGQRDIKVIVRNVTQAYGRPYLTGDQITTKGALNPVIYSAEISTTCAVTSQIGNWLQAGTLSSTSRCSNPVVAGTFSVTPICVCTAPANTGMTACSPQADDTASNILTSTGYGTTAENVKRKIICHGYK